MARRGSPVLEYKSSEESEWLKMVCALSNCRGGTLEITAEDTERPPDLDELVLAIENAVNGSIEPRPLLSIQTDPERGAAVVRVAPGPATPYLYRAKAYRQSGTAAIEVDQTERVRLELQGLDITFDRLPSERQDLTFHRLGAALIEGLGLAGFNADTLRALGLYQDGRGYDNAAALLADENGFPVMELVRYGRDHNEIVKRERLQGVSALEALERAEAWHRDLYVRERVTGDGQLETVEVVPLPAFRSAVATALAQRDWLLPEPVVVTMDEHGVTVTSPGELPSGMTMGSYLAGAPSLLRNPELATVFLRLGLVANLGSGVRSMRAAYEGSLANPMFEFGDSAVTVHLPAYDQPNLTPTERRVLTCLVTEGPSTRARVAAATGFAPSTASKTLATLCAMGLAVRSGGGRSTTYHAAGTEAD